MTDVERVRVLGTDPVPPRKRTPSSPPRWGLMATAIISSFLFGYLAGAQRAIDQAPVAAVATPIIAVEHNPDPAVVGPASAAPAATVVDTTTTTQPPLRFGEGIPHLVHDVDFNATGAR